MRLLNQRKFVADPRLVNLLFPELQSNRVNVLIRHIELDGAKL